MPNDLLNKEKSAGGSQSSDAEQDEKSAIQQRYDREFASLTNPDHYKKTAKNPQDQVGRGFTGGVAGGQRGGRGAGLKKRVGKIVSGLSKKQKIAAWTGLIGAIVGLFTGGFSLINLLNVFQLDNFLNNVEAKGFLRYQVDMEGRSNNWISAYLMLRLAEVEDPTLKPANRDNIIFRANNIDFSNPGFTWYKLMRGGRFSPLNDYVTKFEEDLYELDGIKFASIACRGTVTRDNECIPGGNVVRFRPAVITVRDGEVEFEPTKAEIKAIQDGNINGFNGRLRQFIEVEIMGNDSVARQQIRDAVNARTKKHQVIKRWYLRKSIQNMTGVRDWRFFETKRLPCVYSPTELQTKDECAELRRSIFNKIIAKTFPESMTGGKIIQCIFGITSCRATTDPNDPASRSPVAPLPEDCGESTNPDCKVSATDENGNSVNRDNTAAEGLKDGVSGNTGDTSDSITKKMTQTVLKKLGSSVNPALSIVSVIDQLNIINKNINNGSLSSIVYMARATQAIGLFTTLEIMRDQMRTGEVQAEEVNAAMEFINNAGNSEGWQEVVAAGDKTAVSAAEFETTNSKNEYCKVDFQEKLVMPENREVANRQYHWLCSWEKIGGDNLAKDIEDGWKNSVGVILDPILAAYNKSGLSTVMGWVNSALDAVFENTVAPLMKAILSATGLNDKIEDLVAWMTTKVAAVLGAGPALSENAPGGVVANHAIMGATAAAEFAARTQGAAATNEQTARESNQRVAEYLEEKRGSMSTFDKYLALSNPDSAAAKGLFAITNGGIRKTFMATVTSLFSGSLFAPQTSAATGEGYAAANFAGVKTYDFPAHCSGTNVPARVTKLNIAELDANDTRRNYFPLYMTPLSATNADDLGLIKTKEISWELISSHEQFTNKLYAGENPDTKKIDKVWNCALLDSSIQAGLGAMQNSKTLDENAYGYGYDTGGLTTSGAVGDIPSGTTQELAQRILEHPNISFQVMPVQENYMKQIAKTGRATACGGPKVSPTLLGVILAAAEKYKIVVGVLVNGHDCDGGFHPKGMAVDLNGVNPLSGTGGTGNRIEWSAAEQGILKRFYDDVGPLLSQAGGGGLGEIGCFRGTKPTRASGVSYFADSCNHIHLDVGKR